MGSSRPSEFYFGRERTTLGSSRSPKLSPRTNKLLCDGSSIATLNQALRGSTPMLIRELRDWKYSQIFLVIHQEFYTPQLQMESIS
ncbi:hypothetical protein Tco_1354322 [Tanacetum coccineum]